jgi:hypothetical protein
LLIVWIELGQPSIRREELGRRICLGVDTCGVEFGVTISEEELWYGVWRYNCSGQLLNKRS